MEHIHLHSTIFSLNSDIAMDQPIVIDENDVVMIEDDDRDELVLLEQGRAHLVSSFVSQIHSC